MPKTLLIAIMCSGIFEIMRGASGDSWAKEIQKSQEEFQRMDKEDGRRTGAAIALFLLTLFWLGMALGEMLVVILGIIYTGGNLRLAFLSTFALAVITGLLKKVLADEAFTIWYFLDCMYCAAVFLAGPFYLK